MTRKVIIIFIVMFILPNMVSCRQQPKPFVPLETVKPAEFKIHSFIPEDVEHIKDVEFGKGGDKPLRLNILRPKNPPEKPMPVIVWIHGGGWNSGSRYDFIESFSGYAQQGYFFVSIDHRYSFQDRFPAQIEDSKCAVRFLRAKAKEYNIDADRIGIWGASSGGHLASLVGTAGDIRELEGNGGWMEYSSRVKAVCDWFGPVDFTDNSKDGRYPVDLVSQLLGGSPLVKRDLAIKASATTYISKDDPPFLIMHGDSDPVVPYTQSEILYERLKAAGLDSTLDIIKGASHGFGDVREFKKVLDFFDKHLK